MSSNDSNVDSPRRFSRPRVSLKIPQISFRDIQSSSQHSPYIMSAAMSQNPEQPDWPNPVIQQLYAQRAGDFVLKQFSGLNRFTKSGLSVGEKSVVWLYAKFRTWSRKWFTHCFLFIVVLLYSIAGSAIFMALEGTTLTLRYSCFSFLVHDATSKLLNHNLMLVNRTAISCWFARKSLRKTPLCLL